MAESSPGNRTKILLAAAGIDRITKMMAKQLEESGFEVMVAANLAECKEGVQTNSPDIVLMDGGIEYAADLRWWLKGELTQQLLSLIALYPEVAHPEKQPGFKVLEDQYLVEPYEFEGLKELLEHEARQLTSQRQQLKHKLAFRLSSQIKYLETAGEFMEFLAGNLQISDEKRMGLLYACREALENALQHGNKNDAEKFVHVNILLSEEKLTLKIKDEGEGFDVAALLGEGLDGDAVSVARKRYGDKNGSGLGIMLMLRCVDKVQYNRKGNEVTLTKNLF
ncbi:MAG: ATP-binding protein [Planctomycetes bacterium]|nr:ATP-binding protein [Planctomycetota bacterium]